MTFLGTITSPDNAHVKYARSLHQKRARYRDKRYLLEGLRLVGHALDAGHRPALAFYTAEFATGPGEELIRVAVLDRGPRRHPSLVVDAPDELRELGGKLRRLIDGQPVAQGV